MGFKSAELKNNETVLTDVEMTTFKNRICTQYKKLPLCNPDFIYLDGPDQFKVKKDINSYRKGVADVICCF